MKLKVAFVVAGLLAGTIAVAAPPAQALEAGCQPTEAGFRCLYPMTVKYDGMTEVFRMVESPGTPGFLTSARATLVDDEGRRVGHHMAHLHHAVRVNPQKQDLACSQWPDRFFGSGKERTPMRLPDGYGYEVGPNDWGFTAHVDGMHARPPRHLRGVHQAGPWVRSGGCGVDRHRAGLVQRHRRVRCRCGVRCSARGASLFRE